MWWIIKYEQIHICFFGRAILDTRDVIELVILIILILLSAFFSSAETALTTVSKFSLRALADSGNKRAARVLKVTENSSKLISTILIGNNIVNISASALTTTFVTTVFGSRAVGVATGILTLIVLLFGEITPKTLAQMYNTKISLLYIDVIQFLMFILTPVIFVVDKIAGVIFFILRIDRNASAQKMTEDELISMVNVSEEEGVIEDKEKEMITNVVDFGDSIARDVMIPRADMASVSSDISYRELLELYMEVPYTRIPVYESTKDNIVGILHIKDLFFYKATHTNIEDFSVTKIMRKPLYVYEFQKTNSLLHSMKTNSNAMCIVLDEYGICIGLVTMEDLVEEIIGDIKDEYDYAEHNNIIKIDDSHFSVDGSIKLDDLSDLLNIDIQSEDYDSLGGYITELLDHIPAKGDTVRDEIAVYKVTDMDKKRVARVLLEFLPSSYDNETL
jgi:CBS domain containing-hemolysin-like protein